MDWFLTKEERIGNRKSKDIDRALKKEKVAVKKYMKDYKLVLIGSADSGKSTIMKQLRIRYKGGFSADDRELYKSVVYSNTLQSLNCIVEAMASLHINFKDLARKDDVTLLCDVISRKEDTKAPSSELLAAMRRLWADDGVQDCFARSNEYRLNDSAKYFLDDLDRIGDKNFAPTDQDILRTYVKTAGIEEIYFQVPDTGYIEKPLIRTLRVYDVGSTRPLSAKWIESLHHIRGIIFCAALNEYAKGFNGNEASSPSQNQMKESLQLFESMCKRTSKWNFTSATVLFLNKKDIFQENLKKYRLSTGFPEYTGAQTYEEAAAYIQEQFVAKYTDVYTDTHEQVYCHQICAVETSDVQTAFEAASEIVRSYNRRYCAIY